MEDLCHLLFELSSMDRLRILNSLQEINLKLSQVSKELDMTVTEASRHLQRLSDIQLITKDVDGAFLITPYGKLALRLLSGLSFISVNRPFFMDHDALRLPADLIDRISVLSKAELNTDIVRVLAHVDEMFSQAEEYIWVMSYSHSLPSTIPIVEDRLQNEVVLQRIFPEEIVPPKREDETIPGPCRTLPKVDFRIMMTEKEAMCSLPTMDGKNDYSSFISSDPVFHKWCKDLYGHYWDKAEPSNI